MTTTWSCRLTLDAWSRPGLLAGILNVFAERGISLDQVLATDQGGKPTIIVTFAVSEQMRDFIARRLTRMPDVVEVVTAPAAGRAVWDADVTDQKES